MITAEPISSTLARRKRLAALYPELEHSTPSQIAEVDGAYPDALPTTFTQEQVRLANYAAAASGDVEDAAPNVLPWQPQAGPLTAPAGTVDVPDTAGNVLPWQRAAQPQYASSADEYQAGLDEAARIRGGAAPTPERAGYAGDLGGVAGQLGRAINPLNANDPNNLFSTAAPEGSGAILQEVLRPANYMPIGEGALALRVARGVAGGVVGRLAGEKAAEALPEGTPEWARTGVGLAAGLAGGAVGVGGVSAVTGGRVRTWMEAAEDAYVASSGASEAALRAAQPEAFQFGRGTLTDTGALRRAAVRPDDLIPRRTLVTPEQGWAGGLPEGGAMRAQPNEPTVTLYRGDAAPTGPLSLSKSNQVASAGRGLYFAGKPSAAEVYGSNLSSIEVPESVLAGTLDGTKALPPAAWDAIEPVLRKYGLWDTARFGARPDATRIETIMAQPHLLNRTPAIQEQATVELRRALGDAGFTGIKLNSPRTGETPLYSFWDEQAIQRLQRGEPLKPPTQRPFVQGGIAGGAEIPEDAMAILARKRAEGMTPEQALNDPEVQAIMARVFAPDFNATPEGPATAADITAHLRRARVSEARDAQVPRFPLEGGPAGGAEVPMPLARGQSGRVPLESIRTRPEVFQARDVAPGQSFDERRVQELVAEWNPERLDPITVAVDPEGGYVVTSGHHRLEAARRVGMEDIPVRVADVDLRSQAGQRTAQREAILSNFSVAEQNVRERVRAFEALAADGMSPDEIGAAARMSADRVQRTLDIGTAGPAVVERVTQNPTLEGIAAEVGRFRRLHGLSDEDAAGTFNAITQRGRGESIPSAPAVRQMLDRLAPAFEHRQLPGFEGQGFGGDATPLYAAVREGARLQDELTSAQRRIAGELSAVERLGERAGVDTGELRAVGQRELDAIGGQLANLEQSVMERVRTQAREQGAQPRLGAVPNQGDIIPAPRQEGPDLFAAAGLDRMERPVLPASDRPTAPQAALPREVLDIKGPEASWVKRGANFLVDIGNLPRSLMASLDLSGSLRQGGWLAPRHNAEWRRAFKAQLQSLGSEEAATRIEREIADAPLAGYRPESLYMTDWRGNDLNKLEEQFASRFAGKLPGIAQTSRAYATMLNKLRADTFDAFVAQLTPEQRTPQRLEEYARYVNAATGRGNLPKAIEALAPAFNAVFFSPRFLASIPQRHLAAFTSDPFVRKEVLKDMGAFYGTGMTLIGSLVAAEQAGLLPGVHVETDYNSPDWGKARIGNTRIDIWGGQQQFARMMARATASTPGWVQGKNEPGDNPVNILFQFLRYKASPGLNLEEQLRTGETAVGEKQSIGEATLRQITPLLLQEMHDAYDEGGVGAAALTVPSVLGLGVSTYGGKTAAASTSRGARPARPARLPRPVRPARPARPVR